MTINAELAARQDAARVAMLAEGPAALARLAANPLDLELLALVGRLAGRLAPVEHLAVLTARCVMADAEPLVPPA